MGESDVRNGHAIKKREEPTPIGGPGAKTQPSVFVLALPRCHAKS